MESRSRDGVGKVNMEHAPEMKIQSVHIQNFRALKDVTILFDSVTTFIGPNGAGKSTVLRALDWFFNGKSGSLTEKDCSFGVAAENIEVQVTFNELTDTDREALGKYAPDGVATFTAWKRRSPDGVEVLSANAKGFSVFNVIKAASGAAAKKNLYATLRSSRSFEACKDVEAAAGISLAKNQLAYRLATLKAGGTVPEMLNQILTKAEGK